MNNTTTYNSNMIPCISFDENSFSFIFVDTKNNTGIKSVDATVEWLTENNIEFDEFSKHCVTEYNFMKDMNVEKGIISYFSKDDETIHNFCKTLKEAASHEKIS